MALVLKDRVRQTSTSTGPGAFTLSGTVAGFQSFSAIGTGNSTYYTIAGASDWEVGIGTWTSPNQLSRDTILASTNGGAAVSFGAGTKDVFATFPAEGFAVAPPIGGTTPNFINGTTISGQNFLGTSEIGGYNLSSGVGVGATGFAKMQLAPTESTKTLHLGGTQDSGDNLQNTAVDFPYGLRTSTLSAYPGTTLQLSSSTLAVSGSVSGTGFTNYFASPPPIGGTTPNTITGTTVTATNGSVGFVLDDSANSGVIGTFYIDPTTYNLTASVYDTSFNPYQFQLDTGLYLRNGSLLFLTTPANTAAVSIQLNSSSTSYGFFLPSGSGSNNQVLKTDGSGYTSWIYPAGQGNAPVTITAATYTVAATDIYLIANRAGTVTLTLPTASSSIGRIITVKNVQAQTVVSASSNVVPIASTTAGTAILAATAGKFATLVSDGTNWVIMQAN